MNCKLNTYQPLDITWKIALSIKSAIFKIPATIKKNGIFGSILHVSEETFESLMFAETSISPKSTLRHLNARQNTQ